MKQFILASSSPRRQTLLEQVGLTFETCIPDIDESFLNNEIITDYAIRMAEEKAIKGYQLSSADLASNIANNELKKQIVIGSDTCGEINGELLGKPVDFYDAKKMLEKLSGSTHFIHTSYAIYDGSKMHSGLVTSSVSMRNLTEKDIVDYWETGEPCDKAGAYAIQGIGAKFISNLSGSYSAVMGLPLYEISQCLDL